MAKTSKQIQGDIYRLLRDSDLFLHITGDVYRSGMRPRDSEKEDAVVIFTTGVADEIQTGVVTVNIFVPDIDPWGNGVKCEDGERTEEIECLAQRWVDTLTAEVSNYIFKLQQTIYTETEPETNQHFVVVKLKYKYYGNDHDVVKVPQKLFLDAQDANGNPDYSPCLATENDHKVEVAPIVRNIKV